MVQAMHVPDSCQCEAYLGSQNKVHTSDDDQCDENVPLLNFVVTVWCAVVQKVHLNNELGHDIDNGGQIKEPAEEIDLEVKDQHITA